MAFYGLFGAGGFGREVMPLVAEQIKQERASRLAFVVSEKPYPSHVNGYEVLDLRDFLNAPDSDRRFNIAVADLKVRKRFAEEFLRHGCRPFSIVAASHIRYDEVSIGEGGIFCANTVVTSNVRIGRFFHCNIYSYVAHDCSVGDFVTFAPGVRCNGRVTIEDDVYVGSNAVIREGTPDVRITIGKGAVIGMGAVVTKSVAPYSVMVGNPARVLRQNPVEKGG